MPVTGNMGTAHLDFYAGAPSTGSLSFLDLAQQFQAFKEQNPGAKKTLATSNGDSAGASPPPPSLMTDAIIEGPHFQMKGHMPAGPFVEGSATFTAGAYTFTYSKLPDHNLRTATMLPQTGRPRASQTIANMMASRSRSPAPATTRCSA
jgi:hypothetical protein